MEPRSRQSGTNCLDTDQRGAGTQFRRLAPIVWMLAGGLGPAVCYVTAMLALVAAEGRPFDRVHCFHPDLTPAASFTRQALAVAVVMAAFGFLFAAPGLLGANAIWTRFPQCRTTHIWSLAINTLALVLVYLLLRHTGGVNRTSFTAGWTIWTLFLAWGASDPGCCWSDVVNRVRNEASPLVIGLAFVLASIVWFFPEQSLQCFNEDGAETHELASSLRSSLLPAWEIETDVSGDEVHYGTVLVNPSFVNSYWTSALQVLLGEGELAARLPYWVWWIAICFMCWRLIRLTAPPQRDRVTRATAATRWIDGILVGLLAMLVSVLFTFYVGYNPYMADLANPGVTNALFTLCFLAMLESLFHRESWAFAASVLLGSLVLHSGVVMLVLILAAAWWWQPITRQQVWRWGGLCCCLLLLVVFGYVIHGATEGVLALWIAALDVEYVNDYLAPVPRWQSGPLFLGYFVLGCGGVAAWGLVNALRQGPWQRTTATATCGYLAVVLMSGFKNLHYLGPLFPVPLILLVASLPAGAVKPRLLVVCSLLLCLALAWPAERSTFVLNRHLGERTTFATDSYPEAVQWARLRYALQSANLLSWDCDQHSWVAYGELDRQTKDPRTLLVTAYPPLSADYKLVAAAVPDGANRTVALYTRDPDLATWMTSQTPRRPLQRYPLIMRPLADGPFSPHNNLLEDVRRLRTNQR